MYQTRFVLDRKGIKTMKIPDEWHRESAYNCLSKEDFALLQETYEVGDELGIDNHDCECETYHIHKHHRCACGNRRCCIECYHYDGKAFFGIEVF